MVRQTFENCQTAATNTGVARLPSHNPIPQEQSPPNYNDDSVHAIESSTPVYDPRSDELLWDWEVDHTLEEIESVLNSENDRDSDWSGGDYAKPSFIDGVLAGAKARVEKLPKLAPKIGASDTSQTHVDMKQAGKERGKARKPEKQNERGPYECRLCFKKKENHRCEFVYFPKRVLRGLREVLRHILNKCKDAKRKARLANILRAIEESLETKPTKISRETTLGPKGPQKCSRCHRLRKGHDCIFAKFSLRVLQQVREEIPEKEEFKLILDEYNKVDKKTEESKDAEDDAHTPTENTSRAESQSTLSAPPQLASGEDREDGGDKSVSQDFFIEHSLNSSRSQSSADDLLQLGGHAQKKAAQGIVVEESEKRGRVPLFRGVSCLPSQV